MTSSSKDADKDHPKTSPKQQLAEIQKEQAAKWRAHKGLAAIQSPGDTNVSSSKQIQSDSDHALALTLQNEEINRQNTYGRNLPTTNYQPLDSNEDNEDFVAPPLSETDDQDDNLLSPNTIDKRRVQEKEDYELAMRLQKQQEQDLDRRDERLLNLESTERQINETQQELDERRNIINQARHQLRQPPSYLHVDDDQPIEILDDDSTKNNNRTSNYNSGSRASIQEYDSNTDEDGDEEMIDVMTLAPQQSTSSSTAEVRPQQEQRSESDQLKTDRELALQLQAQMSKKYLPSIFLLIISFF